VDMWLLQSPAQVISGNLKGLQYREECSRSGPCRRSRGGQVGGWVLEIGKETGRETCRELRQPTVPVSRFLQLSSELYQKARDERGGTREG